MLFYVTGRAKTITFCDCPDCNGDHDKTISLHGHLVMADDPEEAVEQALRWIEREWDGEFEKWIEGPDVDLVPAAVEMRLAGAAPLPGMEELLRPSRPRLSAR